MRHPFHLVERSPWPFFMSMNMLFMLLGFMSYMSGYKYSYMNYMMGLMMVMLMMLFWFYDMMMESLYLGYHTYKMSYGLMWGYLLFLLTEMMLFFSFFWAYFHEALNPTYLMWPPMGIELMNPWSMPLLNTLLLLYSGMFCTWGHHNFLIYERKNTYNMFLMGIMLGMMFFFLQMFEYLNSSFDMTDSVYGSTFFILTGLHGFHVIIGLMFLFFSFMRIISYHNPHLIIDLALLYWHLVDIMWMFLFILIYYMAY